MLFRIMSVVLLALMTLSTPTSTNAAHIPEIMAAYNASDWGTLRRLMKEHAEKGDPEVQHDLALAMRNGDYGFAVDEKGSYDWERKSANQGYGPAEYQMGFAILQGVHFEIDYVQAVGWLEKAAAHGVMSAYHALIGLYRDAFNGYFKDFPTDIVEAYKFGILGAGMEAMMVEAGTHVPNPGVPADQIRMLFNELQGSVSEAQAYEAGKRAEAWVEKMAEADAHSHSDAEPEDAGADDIEVRLEKLKKLEDAGLITPEEAAEKRREILENL